MRVVTDPLWTKMTSAAWFRRPLRFAETRVFIELRDLSIPASTAEFVRKVSENLTFLR
jgi:hypothetical protein